MRLSTTKAWIGSRVHSAAEDLGEEMEEGSVTREAIGVATAEIQATEGTMAVIKGLPGTAGAVAKAAEAMPRLLRSHRLP